MAMLIFNYIYLNIFTVSIQFISLPIQHNLHSVPKLSKFHAKIKPKLNSLAERTLYDSFQQNK